MKATITTALALAFAGTLAAAPQDGNAERPERERRGPPPWVIEQFDQDGDGKLNEEERQAAREAMKAKRQEMLDKYDADNDGRLSAEERKAAIEAGEKFPPRRRGPGARNGRGDGNGGPGARNGRGRGNGAPGPGGPGRGRGPQAPDA